MGCCRSGALAGECRAPKKSLREASTSCDSYRRKLCLASNIPQSVDAADVCVLVHIHRDITVLINLNSRLLQPDPSGDRCPANGPDQVIHIADDVFTTSIVFVGQTQLPI